MPDRNQLKSYLNKQELERCYAFAQINHQDQFICRRGLLRQLLAYYLNTLPKDVEIYYTDRQKPFTQTNIHFSISHSKDKFVFAFNLNQPIGIDIEWINPLVNPEDIAHSIFSTPDLDQFYQAPHQEKRTYFYKSWVIKEAVLKALGTGFYEDPKNIIIAHDSQTASLHLGKSSQRLKISSLLIGDDYFCALAHQPDKTVLDEYHDKHWQKTFMQLA